MLSSTLTEFQENVLVRVEKIPCGRVVTHGDVGDRKCANVGRAIEALVQAGYELPQHRIVKQDKRDRWLSAKLGSDQQNCLQAEGIKFRPDGRIDLRLHRWKENNWGPMG